MYGREQLLEVIHQLSLSPVLHLLFHNPSLPSPSPLLPLPSLGWKSRDSVPKLVEEYLAGQLKVDEFVTHTMPLADINKAFDLMHQGERYSAITLLNALTLTVPYSPLHSIRTVVLC